MEPTQINIQAALDGIMHTNEDGSIYWICSELAAVLGDDGVMAQKASEICEKAMKTSGMGCVYIIPFDSEDGDGARKQDYVLTKRGCRLLVSELPLRKETWDARAYFTQKKKPVGKAWKILRVAVIAFPVALIMIALIVSRVQERKLRKENERNDQLRTEALQAGYEKVADNCYLTTGITENGVKYIVFTDAGLLGNPRPDYAFPEDAVYKIDEELKEGRRYEIYGTKRGELERGTTLIEPYCLVKDNNGLVHVFESLSGTITFLSILFWAIIVESILLVAYRKTYQNSLVVADE